MNQSAPLPTIPVIADTIRNIDDFDMVRCLYYSVQSDDPLPNWSLTMQGSHFPILLLNLEAIIMGPPNDALVFNRASDVNEMYNFIEEQTQLFVDINELWIPIKWINNNIKQGMVFRIPPTLFTLCWQFCNNRISVSDLFDNVKAIEPNDQSFSVSGGMVAYSDHETRVFNEWTNMQIEQSQKNYHNNKHLKLKKKNNDEPTQNNTD